MIGTRGYRRAALCALALLWFLNGQQQASGELGKQSIGRQGVGVQGIGMQGVGMQSIGRQSIGRQSIGRQSIGRQSIGRQSIGRQSLGLQGLGLQATSLNSIGRQSIGRQSIGRQSIGRQSIGRQSIGRQSIGRQATGLQGLGLQSIGRQSIGRQGVDLNSIGRQSIGRQGWGLQGIGLQSIGLQSIGRQSIGRQSIGRQSISIEGTALRGIDRVGVVLADVKMGGLRFSEVQLTNGLALQGLQSLGELALDESIDPVAMPEARLQASPTESGDGTYICVDDGGGGCRDLRGTFWVLELSNFPDPDAESTGESAATAQAEEEDGDHGLLLYIADVKADTHLNQSKYPLNDDIYLYTVYYRHPGTAQWMSLCDKDIYGGEYAMAIPTDYYARDEEARKSFTFACTSAGVAAKCPRIWGYKPWKTVTEQVCEGEVCECKELAMQDFYNACVIAARADYCQEDRSFTRTGTTVDLFDTLDGTNFLVPTAGSAYAPGSPGLMLHDEYQISAEKKVSELLPKAQLDALSPEEKDLVDFLQASGLQSSRYPDLDPGRDCAAAPYIDRCDPEYPYACYRANNMPAASYGAFIAINSPRHCSHSDAEVGDAMDPLCNQCVTRVCEVDPTCCADAGSSYFPGSLLWGERCLALRDEVCKSSPKGEVWPPGNTAEPAGSQPFFLPRGPLGAFLGIVDEGTLYAEGWACDPDHPGASIPVQVSIGGELGTAEATQVLTATADQELVEDWQELVGVECGGGSRHGFKIALPGVAGGDEVYAYGIDLDLPGAPFTLLRGGKQTVFGGAGTTPNGLLYSGWLEAPETGDYAFQASAGANDIYRVWINGWLVAADATYPDPEVEEAPGEESPPPRETVRLERGVSYMVRVEHGGNQPDSGFSLLYSPPSEGGNFVPIDPEQLYPLTEHEGNGLRAQYFVGTSGTPAHESYGEVDHVWVLQSGEWSDVAGDEPEVLPGLSGEESFSAVFEGQVMPPISGIYTFTAESDGDVQISIEGEPVTKAAEKPLPDQDTCSHDICVPGAPVSKTCKQGNFCAARICQTDPFCCLTTWDARCVERVAPVCGEDCSPAPPEEIFLSAGVKYDIRVDYAHSGGPGGKLRLLWSLPGTASYVIPEETLFAATGEPLASLGTGLNATWFSDEGFLEEFAHTYEVSLDYQRDAALDPPPTSELEIGVVCDDLGAPPCGTALPPWPPAIRAPVDGAVVAAGPLEVSVVGGVLNSQVQVLLDGAVAATVMPTGPDEISTVVDLTGAELGSHTLSLKSSIDSVEGEPSDAVTIQLVAPVDPLAPDPPEVLVPKNEQILSVPEMPYVVKGVEGAMLQARVDGGEPFELGMFDASELIENECSELVPSLAKLSGTLGVDVGLNQVAFLQEQGGEMSSEVLVEVRVRPPALTISNPKTGTDVDSSLLVEGLGADQDFGSVYIADGDGKYFARLKDSLGDDVAFGVNPDGSFGGTVELDYGLHRLKAFQSVDGVDGDMVPVEVMVQPPVGALEITSPSENADVEPTLLVEGEGALPRSGLRSTVRVYAGEEFLAETPVDDDGKWMVDVTLDAGPQVLTATQLVPSLSGAGASESPPSPEVNVYVLPPAPVITSPASGSAQPNLDIHVVGEGAQPGAAVTIYVDGAPDRTTTANGAGGFDVGGGVCPGDPSQCFTLDKGTHVLAATQSIAGGAEGPESAHVIVSVGDITPPRFCDPFPATSCSNSPPSPPPAREIVVDSTSASEPVVVDFAAHVAAIDSVDGDLPVTCEPVSGSAFPVTSTPVVCEATDLSGNTGRTSFVVTVRSPDPPVLGFSNLVAEAESPDGAPVNYKVTAIGSVGDCSPAGTSEIQACSLWQPANAGLGFTPVAIAADPVQPGTLYAALGEAPPQSSRLFKTIDGGEDWTEVQGPGVEPLALLAARGDQTTLYAPHAEGIEKSVDGGQTWAPCIPLGQFSEIRGASINELRPERIVVWGGGDAVERFAKLSTDGCANFNVDLGLAVAGDEAIYLSPNDVPLYIAEDPTRDPALPLFYMSTSLTSGTRIFKKDGKDRWRSSPVPPNGVSGTAAAKSIYVAPVKNELGYATIIASTAVSRNGGATWTPLQVGPLSPGVVRFADAVNPAASVVYAGTAQGLVVSNSDGLSWSVPEGAPLSELALDAQVIQPPILYGREPSGGISRNDGGPNWLRLQFPGLSVADGFINHVALDPVNPDTAYLLKPTDGLFKTTNGGDSWFSIREGIAAEPQLTTWARQIAIDPFHRGSVYVAGSRLWKSTNEGGVWTQLTGVALPTAALDKGKGAFALDPFLSGSAYWSTWNRNELFVTRNGGANWESTVPVTCEPENLALGAEVSTSGTLLGGDITDGVSEYSSLENGVSFDYDGQHQATIDLGGVVTFDQVTVNHRPDCGPLGHNIPRNVQLEVYSAGEWQPIPGVSRSFDLTGGATTQTFACPPDEVSPPPPPPYGSLPDTYSFNAVTGSQVRWSFDGDGPNVLAIPGSDVISLASGGRHSCAVLENGKVFCWGQGGDGQLGNGTQNNANAPTMVITEDSVPLSDATKVVAGEEHTCALRQNGQVMCWGNNNDGQLGDRNMGQPSLVAVTVADGLTGFLSNAVDIASGQFHTCAIGAAGNVVCWGRDLDGQLGDGNTTSSDTPVQVVDIGSNLDAAVQVDAGLAHTCAVLANGEVYCWGFGGIGALGTGNTDTSLTPVPVDINYQVTGPVAKVAAGEFHTCAALESNPIEPVLCWGYGFTGQLGDGTTGGFSTSPVPVLTGLLPPNIVDIRAGQYHTCALGPAGETMCWGSGDTGQLGSSPITCGDGVLDPGEVCDDANNNNNDGCPNTCLDATYNSPVPVPVTNLGPTSIVAPGEAHTCALTESGDVHCWGLGSFGQLGDGVTSGSGAGTGFPLDEPVANLGDDEAKNDAVSVGTGFAHACVVRQGGTVECWGANAEGQLGDGSIVSSATPVEVSGLTDAVSVAAGQLHSCAVRSTGEVVCWGAGGDGDGGGPVDSTTPVSVPTLTDAIEVTAGGDHSCALRQTGEVMCWGHGGEGRLGNGDTSNTSTPVPVTGLSDAVSVAAGHGHTCAARQTGEVACWGANPYGELGDGTTQNSSIPVVVPGITAAVEVGVGTNHSCAVLGTGEVLCWGRNFNGQLGDSSATDSLTPVAAVGISNAVKVTAGQYHTCAALATGEAYCWGEGHYGQPGSASTYSTTPTPVAVTGVQNLTGISAGYQHTCAVGVQGQVNCWGWALNGALGDGNTGISRSPVPVVGISDAVASAVGMHHSCAVHDSGQVSCWGSDVNSTLGNASRGPDSAVPVDVAGLSDATEIAAGYAHSCALRTAGNVACWGGGAYDQLGNAGGASATPVPAAVTDAIDLAAGFAHTCAALGNGGVSCWGRNENGELGRGTQTESELPALVPGMNQAIGVAAGWEHSCALIDDVAGNQVLCWGWNASGQLGDGTTTTSSSAVQVPLSGAEPVAIAAGYAHSCALRSSGEVACWGRGNSFQLGNGDTLNSSTPVHVTGVDNAIAIAAGADFTCALRSDATVACWGSNASGQLAILDEENYGSATPVTVTGLTDAIALSPGGANASHMCAIRSTGEMVCWGDNTTGQLGDGILGHSIGAVSVTGYFGESDPNPWHGWLYDVSVRGCDPDLTAGGPAPLGDALNIEVLPKQTLVYSSELGTSVSQDGGQTWTAMDTGDSHVVVDRSTQPATFYVGGAGLGQPETTLYATTDPFSQAEEFVAVGGHPQMAAFQRFALDPSGNGAMYAIGEDWTFLVSPDKGVTWFVDTQSPPATNITNLWVSPVDGAVYASALPDDVPLVGDPWDPKQPSRGTLWKRTTTGALPPGARVVQGELRPACMAVPEGEQSVVSGSTFPLGPTDMSCSATDVFDHTSRAGFTITVQDTTPPELVVPDDIETSAPVGGMVTVNFEATAVDAVDGNVTPGCVPPSGSDFMAGKVQTVTCTATDERDNSASRSFNVVVAELGQPAPVPASITVPEDRVVEAESSDGAMVFFTTSAVSGDGMPLGEANCTPMSGSTFAIGNTPVQCTVTDSVGTVSETFNVKVQDTTGPELTMPPDIVRSGVQKVDYDLPTATDLVDGPIAVMEEDCVPLTGSLFTVGTTTVTCRVSDSRGNSSSASFDVTIEDDNPPELVLADVEVAAEDVTGAQVTYSVEANDPEDGTIDPTEINCVPPSGSWFPLYDSEVTCWVTDSGGNTTRGSFNVSVVDKDPPLLDLPEPSPIVVEAAGPGGSAVAFDVSAIDLVDGAVEPTCARLNQVGLPVPVVSQDTFPLGLWEVSCSATDLAGNEATGSFEVDVIDTTDPVLQLPADIQVQTDNPLGANVPFVATATDAVSTDPPVGCTPPSGSLFSVGDTQVTCTARDQARNEATGMFIVTVELINHPPVLELPEDIVVEPDGPDGAIVNYANLVSANDVEDGPLNPDCKPISGSTFPKGKTTTVSCNVVDTAGVPAFGSFTVTVTDTGQGPVFSNVPDVVSAFATGVNGARVTYTKPTATDPEDGPVPVTCVPDTGSQFPVNKSDVTCTASDSDDHQSEVAFVVWVTYEAPTDGSFFLPPVRADGSSVFNIGRVVPVKFRLEGASSGIRDLVATFSATKISDDISGSNDDNGNGGQADTDMIFRRTGRNYMYRWGTGGEMQGTYLIAADLGDGVTHEVQVSLRGAGQGNGDDGNPGDQDGAGNQDDEEDDGGDDNGDDQGDKDSKPKPFKFWNWFAWWQH